jgi:hemerythrin
VEGLHFVAEVKDAQKHHAEGPSAALAVGFHGRVCDWLVQHIGGADKAFARWRAESVRG